MTNNEATKKPKSDSKVKEAERKMRLYESSQHKVRARVSGPDGSWTGIISAALNEDGEPVLRVDNELTGSLEADEPGLLLSVDSYANRIHSISGAIEVLPMSKKKGEVRPASVIRPVRKQRFRDVLDKRGRPLLGDNGEPVREAIPYAMLRIDPPPAEAPTTLT